MNLQKLLLSSSTSSAADAILAAPPHALLVSGPAGSGKSTLAAALAAELLGTPAAKISSHPYFFVVKSPEGKSEIPIEAVRSLIGKMSLRVAADTKPDGINRVVLISRANNLTREAQNALLKLLEEPPANTLLILTSDTENGLLPTVLSRIQHLRVSPAGLADATEFFSQQYQPQAIQSAYMLSRGNAGLLSALLNQKSDHQLKQAVDKAKLFLAASPLERMIQLQKISKNKQDFNIFLDGLLRTAAALHHAGLTKGRASTDMLRLRKSIAAAMEAIDQNANTRLVTLALAVGL